LEKVPADVADLYEKKLTTQILNIRLTTDILKAAEISISISKADDGQRTS